MSDIINKKEKLLVEYLLTDKEIFSFCYTIIKPDYFEAPLNRVVEYALEFFQKYGKLVSFDIIEAETDIKLKRRELPDDELDYFLDEVEAFCKTQAMSKAILEAVDLVQAGETTSVEQLIREAMLVRLDLSIGTSIFDDPESRILKMAENVQDFSTGIKSIDEMVGSVRRGELIICAATSSGGKSLWLGNTAIAIAKQLDVKTKTPLDAVIISLELNEDLYTKRLDVMATGTNIKAHRSNAELIADELNDLRKEMGDVTVKFMHPQSTASDIRAYLLEYSLLKGKYPDVLVVDYIALMGTSSGKRHANKFDEDEEKAIQLRRIATEYNLVCLSAQQLNRSAADIVDVNYGHIAGGISLVNTSDATIALVASEEDMDNNQVQVKALKVRNATRNSKPVTLYKCPNSLRMSDKPFASSNSGGSKSVIAESDKKTRNKLREAMK